MTGSLRPGSPLRDRRLPRHSLRQFAAHLHVLAHCCQKSRLPRGRFAEAWLILGVFHKSRRPHGGWFAEAWLTPEARLLIADVTVVAVANT